MEYEVGILSEIAKKYEAIKLYTDFEDEASLYLKGFKKCRAVPVFYGITEDGTVKAIMINYKSVKQLFQEYCRIILEKYYETCKDRIDITKEEGGIFKVEAITTTYDGVAGMQNYWYTTNDIEIITIEIQEAVKQGFVLRNPISF